MTAAHYVRAQTMAVAVLLAMATLATSAGDSIAADSTRDAWRCESVGPAALGGLVRESRRLRRMARSRSGCSFEHASFEHCTPVRARLVGTTAVAESDSRDDLAPALCLALHCYDESGNAASLSISDGFASRSVLIGEMNRLCIDLDNDSIAK